MPPFEALSTRLREYWGRTQQSAAPLADQRIGADSPPAPTANRGRRHFHCRCGRPVFFGNSRCLNCGAGLGYDPDAALMIAFTEGAAKPAGEPFVGTAADALEGGKPRARHYIRCSNFHGPAACNWLIEVSAPTPGTPKSDATVPAAPTPDASKSDATVPAAPTPGAPKSDGTVPTAPTPGIPKSDAAVAAAPVRCRSCRLTRTVPDLSVEENGVLWGRFEDAKRQLVSMLISLRLPVQSRDEDPEHGLAFDLLRAIPGAPRVITGHSDGIVTIDAEEAIDEKREKRRASLHEPYRTMLGHLRHEIGHYYWMRLVEHSRWLETFRAVFGDEHKDYAHALKIHYENGPPSDWQSHYVSAYASSHPWEDWAESWAHYFHMIATLDTAMDFGINAENIASTFTPFTAAALQVAPEDEVGAERVRKFLAFINSWVELTAALNELCRSMGQPDFYPFVLSDAVVRKLYCVHRVIAG